MTEHEDDGPELPEGFEKVEATVCRRGEELLVFGSLEPEGPFVFHLRLARKVEDFGPPPPGFEWTGEERPPKKGEWFWSELRGRPIQAIRMPLYLCSRRKKTWFLHRTIFRKSQAILYSNSLQH